MAFNNQQALVFSFPHHQSGSRLNNLVNHLDLEWFPYNSDPSITTSEYCSPIRSAASLSNVNDQCYFDQYISDHLNALNLAKVGMMADTVCCVSSTIDCHLDEQDNALDSLPSETGTSEQSDQSQDTAWALLSQRDNIELKLEARNGFIYFIGMDVSSCELVLPARQGDGTVDGRQAVLVYANGAFHLKDLNSSYGTYINERRAPSRCFVKLNEYDEVRFGFSGQVYRLQQIAESSSPVERHTAGNPLSSIGQVDTEKSLQSSTKTKPMSKLLQLKGRKSKECAKTSSCSKLSPSNSSLLSSTSSNSSSSSSSVSPSSVFMSAMKKMRSRFKKKSSKEKSMVCSGNEDITFIRYDSHTDVTCSQSASAPESPSQPHQPRAFPAHFLTNSTRQPVRSQPLNHIRVGDSAQTRENSLDLHHYLAPLEHDYDEVAFDEDTANGMESKAQQKVSDSQQSHSSQNLSSFNRNEVNEEVTSTPDSVVREFEPDNEEDNEDIYGDVDAPEFENCHLINHKLSLQNASESLLFDLPDGELQRKECSLSSSMAMLLPHLNSEDRLNNNSNLDTFIAQSTMEKSSLQCLVSYVDQLDSQETQPEVRFVTNGPQVSNSALIPTQTQCVSSVPAVSQQLSVPSDNQFESKLCTSTESYSNSNIITTTATTTTIISSTTNFIQNNDGTHIRAAQCNAKEKLLSPSFPSVSLTSNTIHDTQQMMQKANGSLVELELIKEPLSGQRHQYNIDNIGNFRRNSASADEANVGTSSNGEPKTILPQQSTTTPQSPKLRNSSSSSSSRPYSGGGVHSKEDSEQRRAHGGMAFVINFDQDWSSEGDHKCANKPLNPKSQQVADLRRMPQKSKFEFTTTETPPREETGSESNALLLQHTKCAVQITSTPTPTLNKLANTIVGNSNSNNTLNATDQNCDSLEDKNTVTSISKTAALTATVARSNVAIRATCMDACPLQSSDRDARHSFASRTNGGSCGSSPRNLKSGVMKKTNKNYTTEAVGKNLADSTQSTTRTAQLSESAVYLINRMLEDSDYHRCCGEDASHTNTRAFANTYDETGLYSTASHPVSRRSISSSRSASPYSVGGNHQNYHTSTSYICHSSSGSTRMEYDESLSSLHSNSDSAQRMSRLHSLTTVVPESESQQVDSAIDDDGEMIADDVSDTGTYTIEIDDEGERHKKSSYKGQSSASQRSVSPQSDGHPDNSPKSDYDEEDADGEVEDNVEDEEEDKLEIARRKIDELFTVYSNRQASKCNELSQSMAHSKVNNATFTRSKRRTSQSNVSDEDEEVVVSSDDCLPTLSHPFDRVEPPIEKSKKRISTELMNAFKKINNKLDKTAKLGTMAFDKKDTKESRSLARTNVAPVTVMSKSKVPISGIPKPSKSTSAPATPCLSENRKSYGLKTQPKTPSRLSRKSSIATSTSSNDESEERQHFSVNASPFVRARSESVNSNASSSNQSSSMRFNRAFALRRARLGMDTCGVEISEQAASKAKESQAKSVPNRPAAASTSFRRNDGGRCSLRVFSTSGSASSVGSTTRQMSSDYNQRKQMNNTKSAGSTGGKSSHTTSVSKLSTGKNKVTHSAVNSTCSSTENLSTERRRMLPSRKPANQPLKTSGSTKIAYSDNEIVPDSDFIEKNPPLSRFGRSSLRHTPVTSSAPWLQSLKTNSSGTNQNSKQRSSPSSALFNSTLQKSSSFSNASAVKSHSQRSKAYGHGLPEAYDNLSDTSTSECVRSIPSFQMGKRFFSTKPHQMAQFDRDFSSVTRCSSASANGNHKKISPDPTLMTHSATESLLNRHGLSSGIANIDINGSRVETGPATGSTQLTPPINTNINARIFSISPLDSLVISAINQLSSKLRTRMQHLLERERSNHSIGSEARSLIDEILPQVSPSVAMIDSRSNQSKNSYSHEPSNISRDLSNILKNLKRVEQVFDVFNMLLEPGINCQDVSGDQCSLPVSNTAIVTHTSDSDTSEGQVVLMQPPSSQYQHQAHGLPNQSHSAIVSSNRRLSGHLSRFGQQQSSLNSNTPPSHAGGGFFIEI